MNIFISSSIKENFKDVVETAKRLETNIEVCKFADPIILEGDYESLAREFADDLQDFSGKVSLHGTFFDLNPASKDPRIVEITAHRYNQSLNIAKIINAKTVVFHTGYNALVKFPVYHEKFIESQILFWQDFIKRFEDVGITVALENTYEDSPEVILKIVDNVNSDYLKTCIDTGHVNINSPLTISEWIEDFGSRLHHMHFHNNFGKNDEHNSLLDGTIDFKTVFDTIRKHNLNPNIIIEIFREAPALESVEFLKKQFSLVK